MKGMRTCKVCGRDFALMAEEHYIAEKYEVGGFKAVIEGSKSTFFDAFDCPHCGCQNVMQERMEKVCDCDCCANDEEDDNE